MQIPIAKLAVEVHPTATPIPLGFHVMVDGKSIAILTYDEVRQKLDEYEKMLQARNGRR